MKGGICKGCVYPLDERTVGCHNCEARHHMRRTLARRRGAPMPALPTLIHRDQVARRVRHDDIPLPPLRFRARVAYEIEQANERALRCCMASAA